MGRIEDKRIVPLERIIEGVIGGFTLGIDPLGAMYSKITGKQTLGGMALNDFGEFKHKYPLVYYPSKLVGLTSGLLLNVATIGVGQILYAIQNRKNLKRA